MNSRDFVYWLQGYFELEESQHKLDINDIPEPQPLNQMQVRIIRNHLNMVFKHEIDPSHGDKAHQEELSKIHKGKLTPEIIEKIIETKLTDIKVEDMTSGPPDYNPNWLINC